MSDNPYKELLIQAASSPHGLKVSTDNPAELRKRLLVSAQEHPDLGTFSFRISPQDSSNLWITHIQPTPSEED